LLYVQIGTKQFPFPWCDGTIVSAMVHDLIDSLLAGHIVICTKTLLHHLHFLATIWPDFITLSEFQIVQKYKPYAIPGDSNFKHNVKAYRQEMIYLSKSIFDADGDWKLIFDNYQNRKFHISTMRALYSFYKAYEQIFQPSSYVCQEINDAFLLLTPKLMAQQSVGVLPISAMVVDKQTMDSGDFWLGLNRSLLPIYIQDSAWFTTWKQRIDSSLCDTAQKLGNYLHKALDRLFVTKQDLLPELRDHAIHILPSMNIFIDGHGNESNQIVGIEQDQFVAFVKKLDRKIMTKSLGCSCCFIGGSRFENLFGHAYYDKKTVVPNVGFPIIFIGSFLDSTIGSSSSAVTRSVNVFSSYFQYVNSDTPDFAKAGNSIAGISFEDEPWKDSLANYVSIKYPGLEWLDAADDKQNVLKLSNVYVHTRKKIDIPNSVKVILMNANSIATTLQINRLIDVEHLSATPTFLPMSYMNPNYCISQLEFLDVRFSTKTLSVDGANVLQEVVELLRAMFFAHWSNLEDSIHVVIERLNIVNGVGDSGSLALLNVCLNLKAQEGCFLYEASQTPYFFQVDRARNMIHFARTMTREDVAGKSADIKNNAQNLAHYEKALARKNLYELKKILRQDKNNLPDMVRDSHGQYDSMSQEAKNANVFHKKAPKSDLNPYAKPFYPKVRTPIV